MKTQLIEHFQNDFTPFYSKYLPNLKQTGNGQLKAICPFHDDTNPSLSIEVKTGLYFCHGCGKKGDFIHFYAKVNGLGTKRDFPKICRGIADDFEIKLNDRKNISKAVRNIPQSRINKPQGRIDVIYDYTDETGKLIFQVVRYADPKDFRQRRPDGKGNWIDNLDGVKTILYRLTDVLKAKEVVIVEGEKCADDLSTSGFTATTAPMGAGMWKTDYNDALKGKDVVLIPDNDLPGKKHMMKVAQSLNGTAKSLKLLDLPGLPDKGDVSDFISGFEDRSEAAERLAVMIEGAKPYEPPKKVTLEDAVLLVENFSRLEISERGQFLFPWLKEDSINLISGWRGSGKTWFALGIIDAVTGGNRFGPWKCKKSVPCLFLDGEMTISDDTERIENLGLDTDHEQPLFIYSDAYANSLSLPRAHLANDTWRQKMKRILITRKIKLWVVDNLASLASGLDENMKRDWDPINQWLLELRFSGISTILLHHVNKDGGQRGTSAREDNIDISLMLKTPPDYVPEDGARFIVHFSKARVKTSDLNLIGDTEFKLLHDETEGYVWTWGNVRKERKRQVLKMMDDGFDQNTIAETLGISKGRVSQLKKELIKEGFWTSKGKLTQDGFLYMNH